MKVSKVKVSVGNDEKQMVTMFRDSNKGALVYWDDKFGEDQTERIIPGQKMDNFVLSILNQTLVKKRVFLSMLKTGASGKDASKHANGTEMWVTHNEKEEAGKAYESIRALLAFVLSSDFGSREFKKNVPKEIERSVLDCMITKKFREEIYLMDEKTGERRRLTDLILEALSSGDALTLTPYVKWKDDFIALKSSFLRRSIHNNRITVANGSSKRMSVLEAWSKALISSPKDQTENGEKSAFGKAISDVSMRYDIDLLIKNLNKVDFKDNGALKRGHEFHKRLKVCLQTHQKTIFGTRDNPNLTNRDDNELYSYNLEVVKYLDHYFPINGPSKRLNKERILHYLNEKTVKGTIEAQLTNAVKAYLIRNGKLRWHDLHGRDDVTNKDLITLKMDEGFLLSIIDACAFAGNNVRNIIDRNQTGDIISKNFLKESIAKKVLDHPLFGLFFDIEDQQEITSKDLWALRGIVQNIRNNIFHYKLNTLDSGGRKQDDRSEPEVKSILNVTGFEYDEDDNKTDQKNVEFKDSIFKSFLKEEIKNAPRFFAQKLISGRVFSYYPFELMMGFVESNRFSLFRKTMPFSPGFKRVIKSGMNYQNANHNGKFYDLGIEVYSPKEKMSGDEEWNARYFLMKLIYNQLFLPYFADAENHLFRECVDFVKRVNKNYNCNNDKSEKQAFIDIRGMRENESITDYLAFIQSNIIIEENKKKGTGKEEHINFDKFLLQVFVKGFDSFLKNSEGLNFLQNTRLQANESLRDDLKNSDDLAAIIAKKVILDTTDIDADLNENISFYTFCKLLDSNRLSRLRNEIIKYQSANSDFSQNRDIDYDRMISIIELCMLSADHVSPNDNESIFPNNGRDFSGIKPYLSPKAKVETFEDLYVQSDEKTPITYATMVLNWKYGTDKLFEHLMISDPDLRITEEDYFEWKNLKTDIEKKIEERKNLHNLWVKDPKKKMDSKRRNGQETNEKFPEEKKVRYLDVCKEIDQYVNLDNKLHLVHLKRMHNLLIELLGRFVGFTYLFERDYQYYHLEIRSRKKKSGDPVKKLEYNIINKQKKYDKDGFFARTFLYENAKDVRNFIAHFNYLTMWNSTRKDGHKSKQSGAENSSEKRQKPRYSLTELINELREVMSYDRKLKNAVSKAVIDLFDKHGMEIKFRIVNNNNNDDKDKRHLKLDDIVPKKITHLGGIKLKEQDGKLISIQTDSVDPLYCRMWKKLFDLKTTPL